MFEFGECTILDLANGYLGVTLIFQATHTHTQTHTHCSNVSFTDVTGRRRVSAKNKSPSDQITDTPEETDSDSEEQSLFFCTEEDCIKSYQRLSSLQNHLDCGKHQYVLEHETLYDMAMLNLQLNLKKVHRLMSLMSLIKLVTLNEVNPR